VTVPDGHYFFMGDNRNLSHDSRRWVNPFVPIEEVKGRAFFRYFPLNRIGLVD
jgi:signal peptidase I